SPDKRRTTAAGLEADASATKAGRWTGRTPDQMVQFAIRRASATEGALAGLAVVRALADRASAGVAEGALEGAAEREAEIGAQASWLAAELEPSAKPASGLVRSFSILGPFQDSGGGLGRREGPEQPGEAWGDPNASYAWGAYEVRWRPVPNEAVS